MKIRSAKSEIGRKKRPAVFLDRDGTFCRERHYLHLWKDWEWLPGARPSLRALKRLGFKIVVVTNQTGVAKGLYPESDVQRLHARVGRALAAAGVPGVAFYHCPHHPGHGTCRLCHCRKPAPGLLRRAAREHGLDLSRSFMIGDKAIDIQAGLSAGATSLLVLTGYGFKERKKIPPGTPVVRDLREAAVWILDHREKEGGISQRKGERR